MDSSHYVDRLQAHRETCGQNSAPLTLVREVSLRLSFRKMHIIATPKKACPRLRIFLKNTVYIRPRCALALCYRVSACLSPGHVDAPSLGSVLKKCEEVIRRLRIAVSFRVQNLFKKDKEG